MANETVISPQIIQQTAAYIQAEFQGDSSGHDGWHIYRVWKNAIRIARLEGGDLPIVELAALLHDLDDWKLSPASDGTPVRAAAWLQQLGIAQAAIDQVCEIITHLSFKGAGVENQIRTLEGMIVQDADRLDAIGAVGIGRAFAYGGHKGRAMHDPGQLPRLHETFEQYQNAQSTTINHFYEKLLLLKERLNTATARNIAEQRHAFMLQFLDQFLFEWDGQDIKYNNSAPHA